MHPCKKKGRYEVTQESINNDLHRRDFDAEQWLYFWKSQGHIFLLRLEEIATDETDTIAFVEYTMPVQIEFIPDD